MIDHSVTIKVSIRTPWKALNEGKKIGSVWFSWPDIEMMQLKGLRYIPSIIYTSNFLSSDSSKYRNPFPEFEVELPPSHLEEVNRTFELLRQKVGVKIVEREFHRKGEFYKEESIKWPVEILDLKEVQGEINQLATSPLLSKDNPEDRKMAEELGSRTDLFKWFGRRGKETLDEKIDATIEYENEKGKKIADFFLKVLEIHRKYPDARIWFYTVVLY
ncbi:MAG: hypothetical protein QW304_05735 [Thermoproteota archaeon]